MKRPIINRRGNLPDLFFVSCPIPANKLEEKTIGRKLSNEAKDPLDFFQI